MSFIAILIATIITTIVIFNVIVIVIVIYMGNGLNIVKLKRNITGKYRCRYILRKSNIKLELY